MDPKDQNKPKKEIVLEPVPPPPHNDGPQNPGTSPDEE